MPWNHRHLTVPDGATTGGIVFDAVTPSNSARELEADSDGTLHYTPVADDRTVNLANGIITSSTSVSNTVTETTVYTESISAGELHAGQAVVVRIFGFYSTVNATDTFTMRLKVAGTTILSAVSTAANVTDAPVHAEFTFTVRTAGASGTAIAFLSADFNDTSADAVETSTSTLDTTAADDVTVTVEWSAADVSNSLTVTQGYTTLVG